MILLLFSLLLLLRQQFLVKLYICYYNSIMNNLDNWSRKQKGTKKNKIHNNIENYMVSCMKMLLKFFVWLHSLGSTCCLNLKKK